MSLRADGRYQCDKCGRDVGNGSVQVCAVVSTVHRGDPVRPVRFDFCREPREGAPYGCEGLTFGPATLADYPEEF